MTHSADGEWFWTGSEWMPSRSPDRAWWWDGARWVPAGPQAPAHFRYEKTPWTRRLQLMVVALTVFALVASAFTIPDLMNQTFQQAIGQAIASQPAGADPEQMRQTVTALLTSILGFSLVVGVCVYAFLLIGIWKLWRWVYWYYVVAGFLSALAIPQDILYASGIGQIHLSLAEAVLLVIQALAWLALSIWMFVLYRRYGTWARRRVPIGSPASDL